MDCLICADGIEILAALQCNHSFCFRCVLRIRVLLHSNVCPLCSAVSANVLLVRPPSLWECQYHALRANCADCDEELAVCATDADTLREATGLLQPRCGECVPPVAFDTDAQLESHLREKHRLRWCAICQQHRPQFPRERLLYSGTDLEKHLSMDAVCPTDPPQFRGHPKCDFCAGRHFDTDALFHHLFAAHLQCPCCCLPGTPDEYAFFKDARALAQHCEGRHHFCDAEPCPLPAAQRVFHTELDLQAHRAQCHSATKGKQRAITLTELHSSAANVLADRPRGSAPRGPPSSSSLVIQFYHGGNRRTTSPNLSAFAAVGAEARDEPHPLSANAAPAAPVPIPVARPPAPVAPPKPKAKAAAERPKPEEPPPVPNFAATGAWPTGELSPEQADEAEALQAIYEEHLVQDGGHYTVNVPLTASDGSDDPRGPLQLSFAFVPGYPLERGPRLQVDAAWLDGAQAARLEQELQRQAEASLGGPMIFAMVEWLKENAAALLPAAPAAPPDGDPTGSAPPLTVDAAGFAHVAIQAGEPITDRKSKFQAFCARVQSLAEVDFVVSTLRANPKIAAAAHPAIVAYRLTDSQGRLQEHRDDDGETGAADKLLYLLQVADARDVVVVVTRWFGGIQLGADRFRHITNVAKDLLQQEGYIGQKGTDAAKPKPKTRK